MGFRAMDAKLEDEWLQHSETPRGSLVDMHELLSEEHSPASRRRLRRASETEVQVSALPNNPAQYLRRASLPGRQPSELSLLLRGPQNVPDAQTYNVRRWPNV